MPFCNEQLWGTLSCSIFVHPDTQKKHAKAVDDAIADLKYGGVAVNTWAALIYAIV